MKKMPIKDEEKGILYDRDIHGHIGNDDVLLVYVDGSFDKLSRQQWDHRQKIANNELIRKEADVREQPILQRPGSKRSSAMRNIKHPQKDTRSSPASRRLPIYSSHIERPRLFD